MEAHSNRLRALAIVCGHPGRSPSGNVLAKVSHSKRLGKSE